MTRDIPYENFLGALRALIEDELPDCGDASNDAAWRAVDAVADRVWSAIQQAKKELTTEKRHDT